jgi:hypothetical protein
MQHFTMIKAINLIGAVLFLVMGIFLIVGFALNLSLVPELKEAANFDQWGPFILIAGIVAVLTACVFAFGCWKEFSLASGARNSVVAETIYILGLPAFGKTVSGASYIVSIPEKLSAASSIVSIFGFGHDGAGKWTFAGRRPSARGPAGSEAASGGDTPSAVAP